jgi:hypothetical protein
MAVALDYCDTVNSNIELFLKDKPNKLSFSLANAENDFRRFWSTIGASGDLDAALAEFQSKHNATGQSGPLRKAGESKLQKFYNKAKRIVTGLPEFVKNI